MKDNSTPFAKNKANEEANKKTSTEFQTQQEKRKKLFNAVESAQQITNNCIKRSYSK